MLINRSPDVHEKLRILGGMAGDDILAPVRTAVANPSRAAAAYAKKHPIPGVYRAAMPNGKSINLLRVMFTDFCKLDCAYCPNSIHVPRKRYAFKVDELAKAFMELHQRHSVAGLFLSSGIAGSGSKTTQKLIQVVKTIRHRYGFQGYVHMKVMPGTEHEDVEAAYRLGTRLSMNIETPTAEVMQRISPHKDMEQDILAPMDWVDKLTRSDTGGAVGQVTQFVVGAADESDADIFRRVDQLYGDWNLKRVYYSAFRPARYTPLEEHPPTPMIREHRLYQMDWLKRVYHFSNDELTTAFNEQGFLPLDHDPKTVIALEKRDSFPMDINAASHEQLLRIPGVGPTSAQRIVQTRRRHSIDTWRDLQAMGVVKKRAWPFLALPGNRPPTAKQLRLDLLGERSSPREPVQPAPGLSQATAPCGQAMSCSGCALYGAPGHPGAAQQVAGATAM